MLKAGELLQFQIKVLVASMPSFIHWVIAKFCRHNVDPSFSLLASSSRWAWVVPWASRKEVASKLSTLVLTKCELLWANCKVFQKKVEFVSYKMKMLARQSCSCSKSYIEAVKTKVHVSFWWLRAYPGVLLTNTIGLSLHLSASEPIVQKTW